MLFFVLKRNKVRAIILALSLESFRFALMFFLIENIWGTTIRFV